MTILTKSQFAASCGVHRSRVSHWISDKKLDGDAIVGTGRKALINVPVALRQLKERLDVDGLVRTGLNTNLSGKARPAKRAAPAAPTARQAAALALSEEMELYESAARRLARALVSAGWPTTEQGAWEALVRGLDELDDQREAVEAA